MVRGHQILNYCQRLGAVPAPPAAVITYQVKLNPPLSYRPVYTIMFAMNNKAKSIDGLVSLFKL